MRKMIRLLALLPAVLLLMGGQVCGLAEKGDGSDDAFGGIVPRAEALATGEAAATLRFSSFSGGGYEYAVKADDPSIVSVESEYEYEDHAEEMDGASYDFVVSFSGLRPGKTTVRVCGRSPILENDDRIYAAEVDDSLRVTLTPVRAIASFYVYRSGEIHYDSLQITMGEDGYRLSINEGPEQPASADGVNALMRVVDACNVAAWDGFRESKAHALDGEEFWLDIALTDGTRVHAAGNNAYPEHYHEAMGAMWEILTQMTKEDADMKLFIGGTEVPVTWEENASVEALKALLPLKIQMSMYGGFEQVGAIGSALPDDDAQITTSAGDIVLYAANQIVIFYGSNSWAYTRLGHVALSQTELEQLLGHGDVEIAIEQG